MMGALFRIEVEDVALGLRKACSISSTSPLMRAAATRAQTLNVFLALALPIETLKLPSVPMIASFTRSTTGGRVNLSVTRMSDRFHTSSISGDGSQEWVKAFICVLLICVLLAQEPDLHPR